MDWRGEILGSILYFNHFRLPPMGEFGLFYLNSLKLKVGCHGAVFIARYIVKK
jgi:hypothetical protein